MDAKTGVIYENVSDEEVKRRKLVRIPDGELAKVQGMNRKQRRAWAAQQRKAKPL